MKKIVITVSGPPGAGKSTHAKKLAERFNLRYFSIGRYFREAAKARGIDLEEFHKQAEDNKIFDIEADKITKQEAQKGGVVLDGHLTGWIAKELADIKIYLIAPMETRIHRIAEREKKSISEAKKEVEEREKSNRKRYKRYYGIDIGDLTIYDIIINTKKWSIEEVQQTLTNLIEYYIKKRNSF